MADLTKIFIRAEVPGRGWDSYSLKELHDMGEGGQAFEWAVDKLSRMQAVTITEEGLSKLVDAMELLGVGIAKVK